MRKYIFGNWKMNVNAISVHTFIAKFNQLKHTANVRFGLAVPYIYIDTMNSALKNFCYIGAQNVSEYTSGAYTGEISAKMLADSDVDFCLVGHSERRTIFGETNEQVNQKIKILVENKVRPILCVGETLSQYENGETVNVLKNQIKECLNKIPVKKLNNLIIAYEPVWAIGTGKSATVQEIEKNVTAVKKILKKILGKNDVPVLYGGSVSSGNSFKILNIDCVDGALIGGASLDAEDFTMIAESVQENRGAK